MPHNRNEDLKDEEIFRLYFEEGWGTTRIARHLGVQQQAVSHRISRAGHKLRPRGTGTIPKRTLEDRYLRRGLSGPQIAERLAVPKDQVYKDLKGHGLWGLPTRRAGRPAARRSGPGRVGRDRRPARG